MSRASLPSLSTQLVRYAATGLLNTGLGLGVIFTLYGGFGSNVVTANAAGYGFGWLLSYGLNRSWTFTHHGRMRDSLPAYLALVLVAFIANIGVIYTIQATGVPYWIAQIVGTAFYSAAVFIGAKYVIFVHRK